MSNTLSHSKDLVVTAWGKIYEKAWLLFIALIIPAIILSLSQAYLSSSFQQVPESGAPSDLAFIKFQLIIPFWIMRTLIYAVVAVSVHRIIIFGKNSLPSKWGVYFSLRELKYIGWVFVCYAPVLVTTMAMPIAVGLLVSYLDNPVFIFEIFNIIYSFIIIFLGAACLSIYGLVLPGTAIEGSYSFKKAIAKSKNIRMSLFIALSSLSLVLYLISTYIISIVTSIDILNGSMIPNFLSSIVFFFIGVFGVVLLSVTYELINNDNEYEKNT